MIVGISLEDKIDKLIFEYDLLTSNPHDIRVSHINAYLVDAPDVFITRRTSPISLSAPAMKYGSMPIDNGWLILDPDQRQELIKKDPQAKQFIKSYVGGEEFINKGERYCLWLVDCKPSLLRSMKSVMDRVGENKKYRLSSERKTTVDLANVPHLFGENRQPSGSYLLIPKVSSERRQFIPVGFFGPKTIASGTTLIIPNASLYHFGVLSSTMHMAWVRAVCGRLESRYQYSAGIVYNNFPWPTPSDKQREAIEKASQAVLDARAKHPDASLADLYDPLTMPPDLRKAHSALDVAVDKAYGKTKFDTEAARVAYLFTLYQQMTSTLPDTASAPRKKRTRKKV